MDTKKEFLNEEKVTLNNMKKNRANYPPHARMHSPYLFEVKPTLKPTITLRDQYYPHG